MKKSLYTLFLGLMLAVSPLFAQEEAPDTKIKKVTEDVLTIVRQDKDIQSGNTKKPLIWSKPGSFPTSTSSA